jgi:branched-chain amino acid transport system substrate-binding protein
LGRNAQYVVSDGFWSEDYPYPGAKRLGEMFMQKFGKHSVSAGLFYSCCQILFQAIEAADSLDAATLRKTVINTPFSDTLLGEIRYTKEGVATFESTANQWWESELKWFYPFKKGAWTFRPMPPWSER